jgi:hypothetical protein
MLAAGADNAEAQMTKRISCGIQVFEVVPALSSMLDEIG